MLPIPHIAYFMHKVYFKTFLVGRKIQYQGCSLHISPYTGGIVQSPVNSMQSLVCTVQCVVCNMLYEVCSIQCVEFSMHYEVCRIQCVVCSMRYEMCSIQCVVCSMHYEVCCIQCVVCSMHYEVCSTQCLGCSMQCVLFIRSDRISRHPRNPSVFVCVYVCVLTHFPDSSPISSYPSIQVNSSVFR